MIHAIQVPRSMRRVSSRSRNPTRSSVRAADRGGLRAIRVFSHVCFRPPHKQTGEPAANRSADADPTEGQVNDKDWRTQEDLSL